MIEFFLRMFTRLSRVVRFLRPVAIRVSAQYLKAKYKTAFLENDADARTYKLQTLALLRQKLHPPEEKFIVDIKINNDIPLKANICQQYCGDIFYGVGFEEDELSLVQKLLGEGDVFFDVGANIGVYSLLASKIVGENGHVHSFEPLPEAYGLLKTNVHLNKCGNVTVNPVAVGDRDGQAQIFVNAQNALSSLGNTNRGSVLQAQNVNVLTLNSYAVSSGVSMADFLKIDVEGFEGHVLRGAKELLVSSPDLIVMSELANKNFKPLGFSVKGVIEWMKGIGFEAWMIRNDGLGLQQVPAGSDDFPYQNFIFSRMTNKKYRLIKQYEWKA